MVRHRDEPVLCGPAGRSSPSTSTPVNASAFEADAPIALFRGAALPCSVGAYAKLRDAAVQFIFVEMTALDQVAAQREQPAVVIGQVFIEIRGQLLLRPPAGVGGERGIPPLHEGL